MPGERLLVKEGNLLTKYAVRAVGGNTFGERISVVPSGIGKRAWVSEHRR
jgi:hypothetical protein